jgi:hypothetical protein
MMSVMNALLSFLFKSLDSLLVDQQKASNNRSSKYKPRLGY